MDVLLLLLKDHLSQKANEISPVELIFNITAERNKI